MNLYIITGSSSGIGKAIASLALENNDHVLGIARRKTLEHPNYRHLSIDLLNTEELSKIRFPEAGIYDKIILVNNAGRLGEIKRSGQLNTQDIYDTYALNLSIPAILMNQFIKAYDQLDSGRKFIINISSGAANRTIDAWSNYCASKAGLDMLSEAVQDEQEFHTRPCKIYSVSPGVIDTPMQAEIRASDDKDFSLKQNFVMLKQSNQLISPETTALKIRKIVKDFKQCSKVKIALSDIELD